MADASFLDRGVEIITRAISEDSKQNYAEAYKQYQTGLDYLFLAYRYEKNMEARERILKKTNEYVSRAEILKAHLSGPKNSEVGVMTHGGGENKKMNKQDPNAQLEQIRASMEATALTEKPDVHWDDVAGLESAKARLKEAIVFPLKFPRLFAGQPAQWVLLYGPYGSGKSYIAKAAATEAKCTFLSFSCRNLAGNVGFERLVKQLFDRARGSKPAMIFLDDIHLLTPDQGESDSSRGQTNTAGHDDTGVVVLAATNVPWQLNGLMKGRFGQQIYTPLPGLEARQYMFQLLIDKELNELTPEDFVRLAEKSKDYSCFDISIVVRDALKQRTQRVISATHFKHVQDPKLHDGNPNKWVPCAIGDSAAVKKSWSDIETDDLLEPSLSFVDILKALDGVKPTVKDKDIKRYEDWAEEFGTPPPT